MSQHHDPVHPDSEHLSAELLADLGLGLLDAGSVAHATAHLAHCPACRQLQHDVTEVAGVLGALPPVPMPDAVWQQLEAALAAQPVAPAPGAATVVPIDAARRRRRPGIGVVAGAAGIALLGAVLVPMIFSMSSTSPSRPDVGPLAGAGADRGVDGVRVPPEAYVASRTGTEYQPAQLDQQVISLVAQRSAFTATATLPPGGELASAPPSTPLDASTGPTPPTTPSTGPSTGPSTAASSMSSTGAVQMRLADGPQAAQACLESYLGATGIVPLAIDIGRWDGRPAAVIVLPAAESDRVEVWVIDPDCSGPSDPLIYFATVAR